MKVSLVIATYNRAELLSRTLASIIAQTHGDFEVIVVDDGSTDATEAMMEQYTADVRIIYERLEKNGGSTVARNRGLDRAMGDIIMVWDSDDVLYVDALATICALFEEHSDAGIISAHCRQIKDTVVVPYEPLSSGYISVDKIVCRILPANTKIRAVRQHVFASVRYEAKNIDFTVNCYLAKQGVWYHENVELGDIYLESDTVSLTSARKTFRPLRSIERVAPLQRFMLEFGSILKRDLPSRYGALSYGISVGLLLQKQKWTSIQTAVTAASYDARIKHVAWLLFVILPGSGFLFRLYTNTKL